MVQFRYDSSQLRIWNWLDQNVGRLYGNLLYQIDRSYVLSLILSIFRRCTVGLWLKKFPEILFSLIKEKGKWWGLIHSFTGLSMILLHHADKKKTNHCFLAICALDIRRENFPLHIVFVYILAHVMLLYTIYDEFFFHKSFVYLLT